MVEQRAREERMRRVHAEQRERAAALRSGVELQKSKDTEHARRLWAADWQPLAALLLASATEITTCLNPAPRSLPLEKHDLPRRPRLLLLV